MVTDAARSFTMALFMLLLLLDESAGAGTGAFLVFVGVVADGARSFTMALLVLLLLLDESAGAGVGVGPGVFVGVVADDSRYFTLTLFFGVSVVDFVGVGVVIFVCVVADGADGVPRVATVVDVIVPSVPVARCDDIEDGGGEARAAEKAAIAMAAVTFDLFGEKLLLF
jgi:hypothetical protein